MTAIELTKLLRPVDECGIRHLGIVVESVESTIAREAILVGDVHTYEEVDKVCYRRGLRGVVVDLAEEIG